MGDKIVVRGLKVFGYHGAGRLEREQGQQFVADIEAHLDLREAGHTDLLGKTLDYDSLLKELHRIISTERYTLLEALAQRLAEAVLSYPMVHSALVRVSKPRPPVEMEVEALQVEIFRSR